MQRNLVALAGILAVVCAAIAHAQAKAPPQTKPRIFAAGVISGPANDSAVTFSPNGKTIYFLRDNSSNYVIMMSRFDGNRWSKPEIASFSGRWRDFEPAMAPDGSYLVFASSRPVDQDKNSVASGGTIRLWRVNRDGDGWGKPMVLPETVNRFDSVFSPTVAADGDLYFTSGGRGHGKPRIYCSQYRNGAYQPAHSVSFSTGQWKDMYPSVAPNESFIVFVSDRPPATAAHPTLFIAFRKGDRWEKPLRLEKKLSKFDPIEPGLGPDGHTLYFASSHVIPAAYPRTKAAARSAVQRMESWNDWNDNIWTIDLSPWLKCHNHPGCSSDISSIQPDSGASHGHS